MNRVFHVVVYVIINTLEHSPKNKCYKNEHFLSLWMFDSVGVQITRLNIILNVKEIQFVCMKYFV